MSRKRQLTMKVGALKQAINEFKDIWKRHKKGEKLKIPNDSGIHHMPHH